MRPRRRPIEPVRPTNRDTTRINDAIRVPRVRLIDEDGAQLGIKTADEAREYAYGKNLDLVEVAAQADPPVARVMDYGKYKYELKQKKKQSAKKQHKVVTKEVRLRPKTGEHDFMVKLKRARQFLTKDYKVQVNVLFRGRERAHGDIAKGHLERMLKELADIAKVEQPPKSEGYRMMMVLAKK